MARRKGSGRGKTIMNSRKSALENARERLKDDPGGTTTQSRQSQQQQQKNHSNSNMEAASTTTTTKHYNKPAKLQNNHHRSAERRGSYRTHSDGAESHAGGDNIKVQKQTAKQAKAAIAAAQRVAATAANSVENSKGTTAVGSIKDPLALGADTGSRGASSRAKDAKGEQKTVGKSLETTAANANNNSNSNNAAGSSSNSKQSDNSNSSSSRNNLSTLSRSDKSHQQQPEQQDASNNSDDKKTSTAAVATNKPSESAMDAAPSAAPTADTNSWNNARYLHKKFKRLASTTDVDSLVAAESQSLNAAGSSASSEAGSERAQIRTTSLSSSSSSASTSSISPPPATTPSAASATTNNEQITFAKTLANGETHTSSIATNIVKYSGALADIGGKLESKSYNNDTSAQQLDMEQLPQTMLQLLENQHSQSGGNSNNSTLPSTVAANTGRYVCPYCNLNCTKPSVLQKHIRAHTNERPYPCDICGIAFKTNSNYYKHCRSRSHAARKRGIEVPISAEDGLFGGSDQEGDPELSNSSSDVISRTASPLEEMSNAISPAALSANAPANSISTQQLQNIQQQKQHQVSARQSPHLTLPSTLSPSSLSSTKSAYLQQPSPQQTQQYPLGSPAAGTLPPPPSANTSIAATTITAVTTPTKETGSTTEHKPYKPKFHNAALYATIKEAAAKAANAGVVPPPGLLQPLSLQHQPLPHQQLAQAPSTNSIPTPPAVHLTTIIPQGQTPLTPPPPTTAHHPSLSPSTQVKLNNHINTHQLQLQMQQQHQQQLPQALHVLQPLNAGIPLHHVAALPPKNAVQRPDMINAVAVAAAAAANMGYMPAARVLYPGCIDFPPDALHMMMPDSRQKLHYPYKWLEQELQQHFHKVTQQQQQQLQHVPLTHAPPTPPTVVKSNVTQTVHNRAPSGPQAQLAGSALMTGMQQMPVGGAVLPPTQQTPLSYLTNTSTTSAVGVVSTASSNTTPTISPGLLHSNISNAVQEHITKLISQNEAIVENKAVLLQKKYPKGLSRSRSFNNNGGGPNVSGSTAGSTSNTGNSIGLVTTTSAGGSESATNAKLAQAIVQKQQQQQLQQQLQQQQHYQQQFQQQLLVGTQAMQMPPPAKQQQQHLAQLRMEEQVQLHHQQQQPMPQQQHLEPNGISKHMTSASVVTKPSNISSVPPQHLQPPHHHQQHSMQTSYRQQQQSVIGSAGIPSQDTRRPTPPPSTAQQTTFAMQQVNALPTSIANMNAPLNLSAKPNARQEEQTETIPASTPSSMPHKRQSIETQISNSSNDGMTSSSMAAISATTNSGSTNTKQPTNVSIIKNLLLNARGLAVPTGEGEDAVYNCPLCSNTFRTAEDLQLHNSTYCQGASSAPISPVGSPSYRYFRSNSMTLNLPELKNTIFRSRDPLPLAKLAWYQLRTKPSSLVLSRLSASQAGSSKATTTTTTSATSTAPTSSTSSSSVASCVASPRCTPPSGLPSALALPDPNIVRLIDAPLPSPGPLLGKTPLVDFGNTSEARKSEDVIITKMHEDRQFDSHMLSAKRPKMALDNAESFLLGTAPASSGSTTTATSSKRLNINTISGGDMQLLSNPGTSDLVKKEERIRRFASSGGCIIPLSECSDVDKSPKMIRTPLLSGGSFQEVSPKPKDKENKNVLSGLTFSNSSAFTPKLGLNGLGLPSNGPPNFQFSINPITAFNPLTLPPLHNMSGCGEKIIPHVPGIPGPNSLTPQLPPPQHLQLPQVSSQILSGGRTLSPNRKKTQSPMLLSNSVSPKSMTLPQQENLKSSSPFQGIPNEFERGSSVTSIRSARNSSQNIPPNSSTKSVYNNGLEVPKKTFNFTRMADNVSPRKASNINLLKSSPPVNEVRHFNFDHLSKDTQGNSPASSTLAPLHVDITSNSAGTSANSSGPDPSDAETKKNKFLRPTSLPLKPGTFTPKRHHGITPTANTLPLISPETPRPSKSCVQLYLNGHAYTYLGLKCSTKMFYCTVNCPQASYVAGAQKLSMYSVWKVCAENNPHPLGFKPKLVMSLYDSRQKTSASTMAGSNRMPYTLVVSQHTVMTPFENNQGQYQHHQLKQVALNTSTTESGEQLKKSSTDSSGSVDGGVKKEPASGQMLVGGYESHEDYTYIRGRGRGRYVCSECGIRCKKPSMLKKHIRTHTDVRPYTCKHCNFSFKTKGNLTKHMQSKTHFKKCLELGINPGPMPADGEFLEPEPEFDQQSTTSAGGRTSSIPGESDSDDYSDNESESSDTDESKSRLLEHEAARCLLSLSMTPPIGQSISPHPKCEPNPYQQNEAIAISFVGHPNVVPATTTSSIHPTGIKRVISFSSPKPPFDYQKQEQYYSNPEESKPKHNNNTASASYESAPIDLTKPRVVPNATLTATTAVVTATETIVTSASAVEEFSLKNTVSLPSPPVQTQAQIRDVIFGGSSNESGFLKTLISVSDKVRSSTEMLESYKNSDELSQAYQYHKAFQYHKIKQIQMNQSFPDAINVSAINQSFVSTPAVATVSVANAGLGSAMATTASANNGMRISASIASTAVLTSESTETTASPINLNTANSIGYKPLDSASNETQEKSTTVVSIPTIEVSKVPTEDSKNVQDATTIPSSTKANAPISVSASKNSSSTKSTSVTVSSKSSDEGEDSECISDQEQTTAAKRSRSISNSTSTNNSVNAESHNAKLPAVVAQPGTTEFTGVLSAPGRTVVVGEDGLKNSSNKEIQPVYPRGRISPDGRPVCKVCTKTFQTQGQLSLHMNIHYMERKFRCEPCGVSFRTQGHLQKHERAEAHKNKVMMTSTFGVPTTSNPRPFECTDCKIAFRIHGHLAKHLRSKTHVQKLECLQKLPFGTYAEIERAGISLTEIDTSDCENSLISLKTLAQKLIEKDPNKLGSYTTPSGMGAVSSSGSGGLVESSPPNTNHNAIVSQDSASEDGFSAATIAAATAIASLDNDSATNTPKRANSTSEDEAIANGLNNSLKRRLPGNFSNGEESDNPTEGTSSEKRARISSLSSIGTASAMAAVGSPASITSSTASSNN